MMGEYVLLSCVGGLFSSISLAMGYKIKNKIAMSLGIVGLGLFVAFIILDIMVSQGVVS
jgi:hypothetical protein